METIYIKLKDEGTAVWRPVDAVKNDDGTYTISSHILVPEDEEWEFKPGEKVVCVSHTFSSGGSGLVASELC